MPGLYNLGFRLIITAATAVTASADTAATIATATAAATATATSAVTVATATAATTVAANDAATAPDATTAAAATATWFRCRALFCHRIISDIYEMKGSMNCHRGKTPIYN